MDYRQYFPLNKKLCCGDTTVFVTIIIIYLAICGVAGILRWLIGWFPVLGWIVQAMCGLLGLYCFAGIILAVLDYVHS